MKDIYYLFFLNALGSEKASQDPMDNINLFICRLSEGLFPLNIKKYISECEIKIKINTNEITFKKQDNSETLYKNVVILYNLVYK
jgi:hypothetical protein